MPSVTIIDGMRPRVTSTPLTAPASAPTATPASRGRIRPPVLVATAPAATAHRPIIEPVEMSISPHRITWLTASAMVPSTATEITMASRFVALRNSSLLSENAASRTARKTSAGASGRTSHRRHTAPEVSRCAVVGAPTSLIAGPLSPCLVVPVPAPGSRGHHVLLRSFAALELAANPALAHYHDPVGHREDLL